MHADVLSLFSIQPNDMIQFYVLDSRCWETMKVTCKFSLVSRQVLLLRRPSVSFCNNIDTFIEEADRALRGSPRSSPGSSSANTPIITVIAPRTKRPAKRARSPDNELHSESSVRHWPTPRLSPSQLSPHTAPASTPATSTSLSPTIFTPSLPPWAVAPSIPTSTTPSTSAAGLGIQIPSPLPSATTMLPASVGDLLLSVSSIVQGNDFDYDVLWALGTVWVPRGSDWPDGMYARDMAKGFEMLTAPVDGKKTAKKGRFSEVFPGAPFNSSTFYRNYGAWRHSTEEERIRLLQQPRTASGLWTACRASLTGWEKALRGRRSD